MNLNEFQRRAVSFGDGPVLVIAGPGSGKTTVITERIHYLIENKGIKPERILTLTFTKAAAKEMEERFFHERKSRYLGPRFMTIHALCYEIIREERGLKKIEIGNNKDLERLITESYRILQEEESQKYWQGKFDYILVDEFQDTSMEQAKVIFLLAKKKENIMVVGDDDQSIYGFRGGSPEVFSMFSDYFPGAKYIQLRVNYRSREKIVRMAERVIKNNKVRFQKEDMICTDMGGEEEDIVLTEYESQWKQVLGIIEQIKIFRRKMEYKDIAVLVRSKAQFRMFLICCKLYAIPVRCKEEKESDQLFLIDDICSYLKIISGNGRRRDYIRIMNKPEREIYRDFLNNEMVDENEWLRNVMRYDKTEGEKIKKLLEQLNYLRTLPPFLCLCHLIYNIGYGEYLYDYAKNMNIEEEMIGNMLKQVLNLGKKSSTVQRLWELLEGEECKLGEGVNLMTMHGSKGLEFEVVFLPDLNEDVFPNKKAVQTSGIEEERRLFYVAITRGKKYVYLSWVTIKNNTNIKSSPFIGELIS